MQARLYEMSSIVELAMRTEVVTDKYRKSVPSNLTPARSGGEHWEEEIAFSSHTASRSMFRLTPKFSHARTALSERGREQAESTSSLVHSRLTLSQEKMEWCHRPRSAHGVSWFR